MRANLVLAALAALSGGVVLIVWLQRLLRNRVETPLSAKWRLDHRYDREGDRPW